MPRNSYQAMVQFGVSFTSSIFKPLARTAVRSSFNNGTCFPFATVNLTTLIGKRAYCSSSKTSGGGGSGHKKSLEISLGTFSPGDSTVIGSVYSPSVTFSTANTQKALSSDKENGLKYDEEVVTTFKIGDPSKYFDLSQSFTRSDTWRSKLVSTMLVYPNFISEEEESSIFKEIEPYISRLHYENSHWDDAIHEYRETERSKWNKKNEKIINRIRNVGFPPGVPQLKLVHILDLAKMGIIKPHIDSIRFCGNTIAGLSLLSDSVMKLRHDVQKDFFCDVYLPRFSLYIMKDFSRYEFTHEILGDVDSKFKQEHIKRDRRISIICRNEPDTPGPVFKQLN